MGMRVLVILIFILNINLLHAGLIEDLRKAAKAEKNDVLLLFHFNILACVKCDIEPHDIIFNIRKQSIAKRIKIISTVKCDRDIELNIFKKDKNWKYSLFRNDGTLLQKLNASPGVTISVINPDNSMLHLKPGNPRKNYDEILKFISE